MVYLLIVFKYIIYGSTVFFTSSLLESTDVLDVLALRFLLSGVVFGVLIATRIIKVNFKGKNLKYIILTGMFEPVLYFTLETLGLSMTTYIKAAIIIAITPIMSCITQRIVLKEKTNFLQNIFLVIGVSGIIYVVVHTTSEEGKDSPWGMLFMLLAVVSTTFYSAFSRKVSKHGEFTPMEITCFTAFMGAVAFNSVNLVRHLANGTITSYFKPYFSLDNIIGFVFLGVISTIIATAVNNVVLTKIPPARSAAFGGLSTLITIVEGVLLKGEKLRYFHVIGTTLIIACMFGVNFFADKQPRLKVKNSK